jgi:hypothetical protein
MTQVKHKPTNKIFTIKRFRQNGNIELTDGTLVNKNEFILNWEVLEK